MTSQMIVQFLHPGAEHQPAGPIMDWNVGVHRRKFIQAQGIAVRQSERFNGLLGFWGEWEAPSSVTPIARPIPEGPRFLHQPFYKAGVKTPRRQNTDPCVFGGFRYTCCQQHYARRPSGMQTLAPGSLILFGSSREGVFVLDTLMVTKDTGIEHDRTNYRSLLKDRVPPGYFDVTLEPWYVDPYEPCRLYEGATQSAPFQSMYSFFPAEPWSDSSNGFRRPAIDLPGIISPNQRQGRKFTVATPSEAQRVWNDVVRQVTEAGYWLGVEADFPPRL